MAAEKKIPTRRPVKPGKAGAPPSGKNRVMSKKTAKGKKPATAAAPRKKIPIGEYVLPFFIFGITAVVFLNFTGMIDIPFLSFLKTETTETAQVQSVQPIIDHTPAAQDATPFFPGPDLETVDGNGMGEGSTEEIQTPVIDPLLGWDDPVVDPGPGESDNAELEPVPVVDPVELDITGPAEDPQTVNGGDQEPGFDPEIIGRLARIYSEMEPAEAASILENIDNKEVVEILVTMKERDVARILGAMEVEQATEISKTMMGRR